MSAIDELLQNNEAYARDHTGGEVPAPPAKKVAIVTCMDARILPSRILGLAEGDAHVIRNAGGVITEEEIRSLAVSQHLLGTEEIMLMQHTGCGMLTFSDEEFAQRLERETGQRPDFDAHAFDDLEDDVRAGIERIKASPFIPNKGNVRGFVYEIETGRLREVS